ncbi:Lsr2 protein [Frankia sp. AiPs1]|uniref:hypothetical protein n=1 Tax=Frankia sp. AiPa1 TaxID=573492 RepID=UPI00202B548D|nr:hypothetical protein [Frankia sp. AiPa1]MCL9762506.1 hypothetical protein [Frankia sp. AiPa1]
MAREVISIVNVWCDNRGQHPHDRIAATTTATLAFDGSLVRLDLCAECRDELSSVLGEYAEFGEVTPLTRGTRVDTAWTAIEENDAAATSPTAPASSAARFPAARSSGNRSSAAARSAAAPAASVSAEPAETLAGGGQRSQRPHQAASTTVVRAWLLDHAGDLDVPVPSRGARLSAQQKDAYDQAHGWEKTGGTWRPAATTEAVGDPADAESPSRKRSASDTDGAGAEPGPSEAAAEPVASGHVH